MRGRVPCVGPAVARERNRPPGQPQGFIVEAARRPGAVT